MPETKVSVERRLLRAADRMYDAIVEALGVLRPSVAPPPDLSGLRFQLQRARDAYDEAMTETEVRDASSPVH